MKGIKIFGVLLALCALPAMAATDKEMEEARTYAAQAYLRYANNGSDYLDALSVKTMSELKGKLKAKELENIKSFEAVAVPKDYASWDKARLSEYWSKTFFSSKGLLPEGCHGGAKARVKRKIEAMTVTAGASAEKKDEKAAEAAAASADPLDGLEATPGVEAAAQNAEAIPDSLEATQKRLEEALDEEAATSRNNNSYTWIYIGILALLVGVVIWLVIFASKVMRKGQEQGGYPDDSDTAERLREVRAENSSLRERMAATLAGKDNETRELRREYDALLHENENLKGEVARLREDYARVGGEYKRLRDDHDSLKNECAHLRAAIASTPATAPVAPAPEAPTPTATQQYAPAPATAPVAPAPAPVAAAPAAPHAQIPPRTIFLGRANSRGLFVRADRKLNIGHTLFRLDTTDGYAGTFRVAADPTVWEMALLTPVESLSGACVAPDMEMTAGMNRIVTESPGTAIFEGGCWKVIRKAKIRYEA